MARPFPILETVLRFNLDIECGHAYCSAIYYDEALSETHEHQEYFNFKHEQKDALRKAVQRAARTADRIKKGGTP